MRNLFAFIAGSVFGTGLLVSGMTDTRRVIGWLDFFGNWDPTLAFVLAGAVGVMAAAWWLATTRKATYLGGSFPARPDPKVGPHLVIGSTLFGMGWGLAGLCPGPSLASLTWGGTPGLVFFVAMALGMLAAPPIRTRIGMAAG